MGGIRPYGARWTSLLQMAVRCRHCTVSSSFTCHLLQYLLVQLMHNSRFTEWFAWLLRAPKPKLPTLSPLKKAPVIRKGYKKNLWVKCSHSVYIMWVLSLTWGCNFAKKSSLDQISVWNVISYLKLFRWRGKILRCQQIQILRNAGVLLNDSKLRMCS